MDIKINLEGIYKPSEDVAARDIQGELIIVPITSGVGDLEDEIFTLNKTGRVIWEKMDGKRRLKDIAKELSPDFNSPIEEIEKDTMGLIEELFKRKIVVEVK
jgi:hypothetical protein